MADRIWVTLTVSGAEVSPTEPCDSCAALMVKLSITGLHEDGTVDLPPILICPDCVNIPAVVDEWRARLRRKH